MPSGNTGYQIGYIPTGATIPGFNYGPIAFAASSRGNPITNAAVTVTLNQRNWNFAKAKSDGSDIRVLGFDFLTPLVFELLSYDSTTKLGSLRVIIPTLPSLPASYSINLYAGNSTAASTSTPNAGRQQTVTSPFSLACFNFSEGGGPTIADSIQMAAYQLTASGSPTWVPELGPLPSVTTGFAISLNGTSQYLQNTILLDLMPPQCTIAAKIKPLTGFSNDGNSRCIYSKGWANGHSFLLSNHPFSATLIIAQIGTINCVFNFSSAPVVGSIYDFILTWTATKICLIRIDANGTVEVGINQDAGSVVLKDMLLPITPMPKSGTPWGTSVSGTSVFAIGCNKTTGTAAAFCPMEIGDLIIENRFWSVQECIDRRVTRIPYLPASHRDAWRRATTHSNLTIGEISQFVDTATNTLHLWYPNATTNGLKYTNAPLTIDANGQLAVGAFIASVDCTLTGFSGTLAHCNVFVDTDGIRVLTYSDNSTANVHSMVTAANNNTTFGSLTTILATTTVASTFANTSITKKNGIYYMMFECSISGVWKAFFATCATRTGTYSIISTTSSVGLTIPLDGNGHGSIQSACNDLLVDPKTGAFYCLFDNGETVLPSEVCLAVSYDNCVTWAVNWQAQPVFPVINGDSVTTTGSNYNDQVGDQNTVFFTLSDGVPRGLTLTIELNNVLNPPEGFIWVYTFVGEPSDMLRESAELVQASP